MSSIGKDRPSNNRTRPCDACSLRRVRCSGGQPCAACQRADTPCTILRVIGKGGPKKPRRSTIEAIEKAHQGRLRQRQVFERQRSVTENTPTIREVDEEIEFKDGPASENQSDDWFSDLSPATESTFSFASLSDHSPRASSDQLYSVTQPRLQSQNLDFLFSPNFLSDPPRLSNQRQLYPWSVLVNYVEIFDQRISRIFPTCRLQLFLDLISGYNDYTEVYALCTAVASATMAQLQLPAIAVSPMSTLLASSEGFARESIAIRDTYNYRNNASIIGCLTSMFLHVYHANAGEITAATMFIRDAVTFLQALKLDQESEYENMTEWEKDFKRKLFWSLLITERGFTMTYNITPLLRPTIRSLSTVKGSHSTHDGFLALTHLYAYFDERLISLTNASHVLQPQIPKNEIVEIQKQIERLPETLSGLPEVQLVDNLVTKQWISILCWQISLSSGYLSSKDDEASCMQYSFPAASCTKFVQDIASVDLSSFGAHGIGMEYKLFEICHALALVILCLPPSSRQNTHRSCLRDLMSIFATFRGANDPKLLSIMSDKLAQINVTYDDLWYDSILHSGGQKKITDEEEMNGPDD